MHVALQRDDALFQPHLEDCVMFKPEMLIFSDETGIEVAKEDLDMLLKDILHSAIEFNAEVKEYQQLLQ